MEFLSKERAERLAARVKEFESKGHQWKDVEERSPISGSLDPYQGEWTPRLAKHLLSRCLWGPTREQVEMAAGNTLDGAGPGGKVQGQAIPGRGRLPGRRPGQQLDLHRPGSRRAVDRRHRADGRAGCGHLGPAGRAAGPAGT